MSKEMLKPSVSWKKKNTLTRRDIIDAVVESLKRSAYKRRYGQSESAVVEFNEKNR